jgi:hypothetical protein
MKSKFLSAGTGLSALAVVSLTVPAAAIAGPHEAAVRACAGANAHQPATLVVAIDDGRGGSLVWLADANANLSLCSAGSDGEIYAYSVLTGDLLQGAGAALVPPIKPLVEGSGVTLPLADPVEVVQRVCRAALPGADGEVIASGPDGLAGEWVRGYYVFLETAAGALFLCDATVDAKVWALAEIGDPLTMGEAVG